MCVWSVTYSRVGIKAFLIFYFDIYLYGSIFRAAGLDFFRMVNDKWTAFKEYN